MRSFIIFLLFAGIAAAQSPNASPPSTSAPDAPCIEITKADFTKVAELRSTSLCFFGVRMGQSEQVVRGMAAAAALEVRSHDYALGLYSGGNELAAIQFSEGAVAKIHLFGAAAPHLAGRSRELLTAEAGRRGSPVRLELLGKEDEAIVERGYLGSTTFIYAREGLSISATSVSSGSPFVVLHLVPPARQRKRSD